MRETMIDRFYKYVKIDTQSREEVADQFPSTMKQKDLGRIVVQDLLELGLQDAHMDDYGYVLAMLPGNLSAIEADKVPAIGFLAHLDTSPEVSGKDVTPCLHENYQGGDIQLTGDSSQVIRAEENPELKAHIGHDIITSDGTTLLGADNKAGIAEILTFIETLQKHPEIKHGDIHVGITPDEEVGNGTAHFDVVGFGADYAYTVDGSGMGEIENETFNAALGEFQVTGVNVHPGYGKGKLVNAIRIMADIVETLKQDDAPETTEERQGYLHPYVIQGGVAETNMKVLIRDFDESGMREKKTRLQAIRTAMEKKYPKAVVELTMTDNYQNMRVKLDEDPRVVDYAMEAVRRTGLEPKMQLIRGGTDGAKLCFMGLLTPNIFTGGHNFHSKQEWIAVQAMEKAVETLVNLAQVWVEKRLQE